METVQRALYLFCFACSNLLGELEGTGVDGQHPLSVFRRFPNLCAVLSEVRLEDFCGETAELRMRDLAWVGPRALRHEAVVEEVMRHSPVLPARFGTLFSSQERLAEFVDRHGAAISQFLERVADQEEWSVRGLLDRKQAGRALTSASLAAQEAQLAALLPGRRYFEEQRIRAGAEKELSLWLKETRRQVANHLRQQASDFCECPEVPREPPESGIEVVLNWAFLLPKSATPAFRARINQVNEKHAMGGLVLELSGPWPPYRFVPPLSIGATP
ncbi:MAG: GvpL/GvpF family gas vesicle protein [Terriglobia bacterium]|jgi:hypothetical protein